MDTREQIVRSLVYADQSPHILIKQLATKLQIAMDALEEIKKGTWMDRVDFEKERLKTSLVHEIDTIYAIAYDALENIEEVK